MPNGADRVYLVRRGLAPGANQRQLRCVIHSLTQRDARSPIIWQSGRADAIAAWSTDQHVRAALSNATRSRGVRTRLDPAQGSLVITNALVASGCPAWERSWLLSRLDRRFLIGTAELFGRRCTLSARSEAGPLPAEILVAGKSGPADDSGAIPASLALSGGERLTRR